MKIVSLICMMAMLLIVQPVFAQQTIDKNCVSQGAIDLGNIGKEKLNLVQNGNLSPGELKWFQFKVLDSARFFMKITQPDGSYYYATDFGLVVYDKDMNYVASSSSLVLLDLMPGSYYVRLDARPYEKANYTLTANNNFETEPNDGLSEANDLGTLAGSQLVGGSIEPSGDADFIKINLAEGQSGKLSIDSDGSDVALVLYAYNESKKYYLPMATDTYSLSTFVDPGTYYLRIESSSGYSDTYNYTLNLSFISMTCEKEPNDAFAQAIDLGALNASAALIEKGCLKSTDDKDFYKFVVPENMSVILKTITKGDTRIYLYDSEEKELDSNDDYDDTRASQIETELLPGEYYVSVDGFDSGITYEISVEAKK
ncbi:MAG: PPC domain-containing protein [Methanothrix sp.]|nr:PPC domain-containing protein [Methanothrix sp.]